MELTEYIITMDNQRELFVIGGPAGVSCLGFDVCQNRSVKMAEWLGVQPPNQSYWGTINGYEKFKELIGLVAKKYRETCEKCPTELTESLIGLEGRRVEVVDSYGDKRRFIVGVSGGWIPVHIELKAINSKGGHAVSGAPFKSLKVLK